MREYPSSLNKMFPKIIPSAGIIEPLIREARSPTTTFAFGVVRDMILLNFYVLVNGLNLSLSSTSLSF
jgi:hypothetical protein